MAVIVLASLAANYFQYVQMQEKDGAIADLQSDVATLEKRVAETPLLTKPEPEPQKTPAPLAVIRETSQSIVAVAVRSAVVSDGFFQRTQFEGLVMNITVDLRDGRGFVLVNTEIPAGVDFQTSARTAVRVASQFANADLSGKDVIFSITSDDDSELEAVDGPSAGAAMTLLLISELQSKEVDGTILVTGTIEPDGTIGRVGGVPEKALAAGEYGAEMLLVPSGEAVYESQVCEERQEGPFVYRSCTSEQKPLSPATEERYGMKVAEVEHISQALDYF